MSDVADPSSEPASGGARYSTDDEERREAGIAAATTAIRAGELVVLPTDTVYGVGADAFEPRAVQRLLDAKGRGRDMPPPVLIGVAATLGALGADIPAWARALADHYWPGPLTLVLRQQSSLRWDLGDTRGTVAVRMPDDPVALELLNRTGPLAVSSANTTGSPAATDADAAERMLGGQVAVILDSGPTRGEVPSTILDCTGERPRLLRAGVIGVAALTSLLEADGVDCEGLSGGLTEGA